MGESQVRTSHGEHSARMGKLTNAWEPEAHIILHHMEPEALEPEAQIIFHISLEPVAQYLVHQDRQYTVPVTVVPTRISQNKTFKKSKEKT